MMGEGGLCDGDVFERIRLEYIASSGMRLRALGLVACENLNESEFRLAGASPCYAKVSFGYEG